MTDTTDQRRHNAAMRIIERVCDDVECEHCRAVPQAAYALLWALGWHWNGYNYVRMPGPHDEWQGEEQWP